MIFLFKEGNQAFEAVKWLVEQKQVEEVVLESKTYKGKYAENPNSEIEKEQKKKAEEKKKKKSEL